MFYSIYQLMAPVNVVWYIKNIFSFFDELFTFSIPLPTLSALFYIGLLFTRTVVRCECFM